MFNIAELPILERLTATAERVRWMIHARACLEYGRAFGTEGCTSLDMCVIHNSCISRDQGKPWQEVNYSHMRKAAWLVEKSHEPSRLVTAWYRRKSGIVG